MVAFTCGDDATETRTSATFKRKREDCVSPGKDDVTPDDRHVTLAMNSKIICAPVKRPRCLRYRKQKIECRLSDSGFEEELLTPSSNSSPDFTPSSNPAADTLTPCRQLSDWQNFRDYGESCYNIQKLNEENYLPVNCLARQPQVTAEARCRLVSWLIPVHRHFKLSFESCCLAVNIMDRFLSTTPVAADCFQLLGVTSLLIASKQVEVFSPRISQLLALCCDAFAKDQLCNLERIVLTRLSFRLATPTMAFFLHYFTQQRLAQNSSGGPGHSDAVRCWSLARRICELSLADYAFNRYRPSVLAACAVRLAERLLGVAPTAEAGEEEEDEEEGRCTRNLRLLVSLNQEVLRTMAEL